MGESHWYFLLMGSCNKQLTQDGRMFVQVDVETYQRDWQNVKFVMAAHTQIGQKSQSVFTFLAGAAEEQVGQSRTLDVVLIGPASLQV